MTKPDLETVAALLHKGWMEFKRRQGVEFGQERSQTTHPHFVNWLSLDNDSQNQDRFMAAAILRDWGRGLLAPADLPAAIHNAWADWSNLQGEEHSHARPYFQAHSVESPGEHFIQADLILPILADKKRLQGSSIARKKCLALLPLALFASHVGR